MARSAAAGGDRSRSPLSRSRGPAPSGSPLASPGARRRSPHRRATPGERRRPRPHDALRRRGHSCEVIACARAAGLDFVVDHRPQQPRRPAAEQGYHGGVLVLVGTELSTTAGHILGLGLERPQLTASRAEPSTAWRTSATWEASPSPPIPLSRPAGPPLDGLGPARALGSRAPQRRQPVAEGGPRLLASTVRLYRLNARYALLAASLRRRGPRAVGRAPRAAEGRRPLRRRRPQPRSPDEEAALRFPSYEALFSLARNHLAPRRGRSPASAADRGRRPRRSPARSRFYLGLDALAPAGGLLVHRRGGTGPRWTMGDSARSAWRPARARGGPAAPRRAVRSCATDGCSRRHRRPRRAPSSGPGVYRVEVRVAGWQAPWVITNPIYVFDPEAQERAGRAPGGPRAAPGQGASSSTIRGHASSCPTTTPPRMNPEVLDPGAGRMARAPVVSSSAWATRPPAVRRVVRPGREPRT